MNPNRTRRRWGRWDGLRCARLRLLAGPLAAGLLCTPVPVVGGRLAALATGPLAVPAAPGDRAPGLRYFRLDPAVADTVFRLLVIPVRFPEDKILGGGTREDLEAKLGGSDASLARYYLEQTGNRLRVEVTLAPTVTARRSRDYYTVDGGGYGIDPAAYPNNAQRLVEEATADLGDRVDFRLFDNTGDGIVDGLLLLHSGPESTEFDDSLPPDVLLAHAFTVPEPTARGASLVFPYATAATRDGFGVWAHEVGHLLGLVDLYVGNGFCPGEGLGEWSLMATGANRAGGDDPTGLDAFSKQLLGLVPRWDFGVFVDLAGGVFLRSGDPGQETGPKHYLVEYREAGDGPAGLTPARVVYAVDEEAVDNRSCPLSGDAYRPLVRIIGVFCPGSATCETTWIDPCFSMDPDCPRVYFEFSGTRVRALPRNRPSVIPGGVGLGAPRVRGGATTQDVRLLLENVDPAAAVTVDLVATALTAGGVCLGGATAWQRTLGPGESVSDSSLFLTGCGPSGALPREDLRMTLRITDTATSDSRVDTLVLPAMQIGLDAEDFPDFTLHNLEPGRRAPWIPGGGGYLALNLAPLAHGELRSPWFTVPADGRVVLDHDWDLSALSADVALDAGQVRLRRPGHPDLLLAPAFGWGFTVERSIGNALGGAEALSGAGVRRHVLELPEPVGAVAQLVFRVAGDIEADPGFWGITGVQVRSAPKVRFRLEEDPDDPGSLLAATSAAPQAGIQLLLYRGLPATTPLESAQALAWSGEARVDLGRFEPPRSRFELLWTDSTGAADVSEAIFDLPVPGKPSFLLAPSPNPVARAGAQTWALRLSDGGPPGMHRLRLFTLGGGLLLERSVRIDVPGTRLILWDGRDEEGRTIAAGVYFLEAVRPDGVRNGRRVVVIP